MMLYQYPRLSIPKYCHIHHILHKYNSIRNLGTNRSRFDTITTQLYTNNVTAPLDQTKLTSIINKPILNQPPHTIQYYIEQTKSIQLLYSFVIGFDINTNGVGYAVIDTDYQYIDAGYIDISIFDNIYNKSYYLHHRLLMELHNKYSTTTCHIVIEDYLKLYSGLKFNIKYMFQLAEINSIFTYHCRSLFDNNTVPIHTMHKYHPSTPRGIFQLKKSKLQPSSNIKQIVHQFVQPIFPSSYQWNYRKKVKLLMDAQYDICDSMLLCCAQLYQLKQQKQVQSTNA